MVVFLAGVKPRHTFTSSAMEEGIGGTNLPVR